MPSESMEWIDINNYAAIKEGARQQKGVKSGGWIPIAKAPKDGTVIEVCCTYGIAPWYGIFSWIDGRWSRYGSPSSGVMEGDWLLWRPLSVSPDSYIDPTKGLQDSPAYWRGASAAKAGLPLDYFESIAARNSGVARKGWLQRIAARFKKAEPRETSCQAK